MIRQSRHGGREAGVTVDASSDLLVKIADITRSLFPGEVTWQEEFDPDAPEHHFLVFTARADGEPREVVDRRCEWHVRVEQLQPPFDCRLSIEPAS